MTIATSELCRNSIRCRGYRSAAAVLAWYPAARILQYRQTRVPS